MEMIYDYLTGTQFKQRVDAIVERFEDMQDNLRKERVFMEKQWALRAKLSRIQIGWIFAAATHSRRRERGCKVCVIGSKTGFGRFEISVAIFR